MKRIVLVCAVMIGVVGANAQNAIDNYITDSLTFHEFGNAGDGLVQPQDLDFVPGTFDLWVMNRLTNNSFPGNYNTTGGSFVTFMNAGQPSQTSQYRKDSHNNHFMTNASSFEMGDNGFFGSTGDVQNTNPSSPTFMGPTLWSHDTTKYAKLNQSNWASGQPLGSHYDMLHESPNPVGIAHESASVYWVASAYNNNLSRYDFGQDHGPGGDNHTDGVIDQYTDVPFTRLPVFPAHMIIDKPRNELYYVDAGNQRINKVDITTGTVTGNLPSQDLCTHRSRNNTTWSTVVSTGLTQPVGIEYYNDRLLVSDYSNGDILIYDVSGGGATYLGKIATGAIGIMGIKVDKSERIWYVNKIQNKVYRIDSEAFAVGVGKNTVQRIDASFYPNPSNGLVSVEINNQLQDNLTVNVVDMNGRIVFSKNYIDQFIMDQMDLTQLSSGVYGVTVTGPSSGILHQQKLVIR